MHPCASRRSPRRLVARLAAWASVLILVACGGGGGGGDGGGGGGGGGDGGGPGAREPRVSADRSVVTVTSAQSETPAVQYVKLQIDDLGSNDTVFGDATPTRNGIASATVYGTGSTTGEIAIQFKSGRELAAGTHTDTIDVRLCRDSMCQRHFAGSPLRITTRYTVVVPSEVGVEPLAVASRTALPHDVIDAEFSRALDAVVMVSSWPTPALHVWDMASGIERSVALNKPPVAVSVSPDGLSAAVGHDGLVTHVDLTSVGTPSPVRRHLNLSAVTGDLVLDGHGHVFVFPAVDQWVSIHSIDVASNTETKQYGPYAGTRARLHPSGTRLYAADNGLSPSDIESYDISTGQATARGDSPYHGDYPMCGDVWPSEDGALLFTACGRAFRASEVRANDMVYAGSMTLSPSQNYGWRIVSLSHLYASREIALIEQPWYECTVSGAGTCYSHLALYESDFLNRQAVYSIPMVEVSGLAYAQRGLFVFHRPDGKKVLISRLTGMPNPAAEYYLSAVSPSASGVPQR